MTTASSTSTSGSKAPHSDSSPKRRCLSEVLSSPLRTPIPLLLRSQPRADPLPQLRARRPILPHDIPLLLGVQRQIEQLFLPRRRVQDVLPLPAPHRQQIPVVRRRKVSPRRMPGIEQTPPLPIPRRRDPHHVAHRRPQVTQAPDLIALLSAR